MLFILRFFNYLTSVDDALFPNVGTFRLSAFKFCLLKSILWDDIIWDESNLKWTDIFITQWSTACIYSGILSYKY